VAADGAEQAHADVIVSGREPRRRSRWPVRPVWLLVIAQAAALAVLAAMLATGALHHGAETGPPRGGPPPAAGPSLPQLSAVVLRLPASGGVAGTVVITAAALPGAGRAQFTVSAVVTGGTPGTFYSAGSARAVRPGSGSPVSRRSGTLRDRIMNPPGRTRGGGEAGALFKLGSRDCRNRSPR